MFRYSISRKKYSINRIYRIVIHCMHIVIQLREVGRASAASGSLGDFRRELLQQLRELSDVLDVFGADLVF